MEFEYGFKCGEITTYVNTAIKNVLKDYEQELSDEQSEKLEDLKRMSNNIKIQKIDSKIEEA